MLVSCSLLKVPYHSVPVERFPRTLINGGLECDRMMSSFHKVFNPGSELRCSNYYSSKMDQISSDLGYLLCETLPSPLRASGRFGVTKDGMKPRFVVVPLTPELIAANPCLTTVIPAGSESSSPANSCSGCSSTPSLHPVSPSSSYAISDYFNPHSNQTSTSSSGYGSDQRYSPFDSQLNEFDYHPNCSLHQTFPVSPFYSLVDTIIDDVREEIKMDTASSDTETVTQQPLITHPDVTLRTLLPPVKTERIVLAKLTREEAAERKRGQNRVAARRYRAKQMEGKAREHRERVFLTRRIAMLREQADGLSTEIAVFKTLLLEQATR